MNDESEAMTPFTENLLTLLVNAVDTGLALFSGEAQAQCFVFNLCYCNTTFETMFGLKAMPISQTLALPIF